MKLEVVTGGKFGCKLQTQHSFSSTARVTLVSLLVNKANTRGLTEQLLNVLVLCILKTYCFCFASQLIKTGV